MATVATTIQPVNSLPSNMLLKLDKEEALQVNITLPTKETIQEDPALYIQYMIDCINRIRGDFHSLCSKDFPVISTQLAVLSDKTANLKQEISQRFDALELRESNDNADIRRKLDELTKEIEQNKAMLERAIDEISQNRRDMELQQERILRTMNEVMQQNNERFDMLSEQINMLTSQGVTMVTDNEKNINSAVIPRGAYTKQEIDDNILLSMSRDDLSKLRNNITSTKCRHKPAAPGEKDEVYEMCVANVDKINRRLQQLRGNTK